MKNEGKETTNVQIVVSYSSRMRSVLVKPWLTGISRGEPSIRYKVYINFIQ